MTPPNLIDVPAEINIENFTSVSREPGPIFFKPSAQTNVVGGLSAELLHDTSTENQGASLSIQTGMIVFCLSTAHISPTEV